MRLVRGVNPAFMNSIDKAITLVFRNIVRLLNMVV
jgi:hypothetical protein